MSKTTLFPIDEVIDPLKVRTESQKPCWHDLGRSEHLVQFYEHDSCLINSVSSFFASGFEDAEAGVIIATRAHREGLITHLSSLGFDIPELEKSGQLTMLDAAETLSQFMVDGSPDPFLFDRLVGSLIAALAGRGRPIRAFGEMVALLCAEGNSSGAILLEELWNDLGKKHTFVLYCAYPIRGFTGEEDSQPFGHICKSHSRVIPAESYSLDGTTKDERLRTIAHLQQKAATLEAQIAIRKRCQDDLARREADLRDFLENATEGIHQVAADGKINWANRAELELLGYQPEEYIGRNIVEFHADAEVIADILARLKRGEKLIDYEARLKHKDGSIRYVSINSSGRWHEGKFLYTRCFTRDITERKRASELLERTVADRTSELRETVAELEAFSYSISHDMRSPLRAMQAYAASLMEDYRNRPLDEEGFDRLARIQRAATRMDLLIRDVLTYSRVGKQTMELASIPLERLVRDIVDQQFNQPNFQNRILIGKLHSVIGHEACLTQSIANLIDNGLKFIAPGQLPSLKIESELIGDKVRVTVSDNGIGIHPDHRDRIFKIFGRVYSEREYPGTGIGLAIVQKAVSRMGGQIGFESTLGCGSTFWFVLPDGGKI